MLGTIVNAVAIVGSLQSDLAENHKTLYAKSMLDFVAAIFLPILFCRFFL